MIPLVCDPPLQVKDQSLQVLIQAELCELKSPPAVISMTHTHTTAQTTSTNCQSTTHTFDAPVQVIHKE